MSSFIQPATIQAIAHSIDIPRLSNEAAKALAPDVEYRLREVIQDATKFARHSKRTKLTTEDVSSALRLRNIEPMYGFGNKDPAKFIKAAGHADVYCIQDRELSYDQLVDAPLPRPPIEVGVMPHWLFIGGVQPAIPENALLEKPVFKRPKLHNAKDITEAPKGKAAAPKGHEAGPAAAAAGVAGTAAAAVGAAAAGGMESAVQVQPPVQHILSKELQLYFDKVVALLKAPPQQAASGLSFTQPAPQHPAAESSAAQQQMQRAIFASLSTDPGLHPLAPYFTKLIADEVAANLKSIHILHMLLRLARCMMLNPHMQLEPYIHQLLPSILTCLVAKSIGNHSMEDHWSVRDAAARLVTLVCARFGEPYYNVQPRISKTLLKAFLDATKPLTTHYGAVMGLTALGHATVRLLLIPQLGPYMSKLQKAMQDEKNAMRRSEAWRVYGALLDSVGAAMYDRIVACFMDELPEYLFSAARRSSRNVLQLSDAPSLQQQASLDRARSALLPSGTQHPSQQQQQQQQQLQPQGRLVSVTLDVQPSSNTPSQQHPVVRLKIEVLQKHVTAHGSRPAQLANGPLKPAPSLAIQQSSSMDIDAMPSKPNGIFNSSKPSTTSDHVKEHMNGITGSVPATRLSSKDVGDAMEVDDQPVSTASRPSGSKQQQAQQLPQPPFSSFAAHAAAAAPSLPRSVAAMRHATATKQQRLPVSSQQRGMEARSVTEVLAESWKEDADLNEVLWALGELFGEAFIARLPGPMPSHTL